MRKRVTSIDGLRGLLALVVVFQHVDDLEQRVGELPGLVAVCLFFVMSGYVLTRAWDDDFLSFLIKRFVRLWPLFAVCALVGAVLNSDWPNWSSFVWYPFAARCDSAALRNDPPMWSLYIEAWSALFMPLIVWSGRKGWRTLAVTAAAMAAVESPLLWFFPVFVYAPFFVFGALLAPVEFRARLLNGSVVQWLGRVSYSLYLTHWMVLKFCDAHLSSERWLEVPLALLVAEIAYRLVERPSILLSRRAGQTARQWRHGQTRAAVGSMVAG